MCNHVCRSGFVGVLACMVSRVMSAGQRNQVDHARRRRTRRAIVAAMVRDGRVW
jgi:hypothetical protein